MQIEEPACAAVAFPIEVVFGITVAAQFQSEVFTCGAVGEGNVVVGDVVEEVNVLLVK
jgi:hypothetical protein